MKGAYGILSADQVVTATAASTNYIDFGEAKKTYGKYASGLGNKVHVLIKDHVVDATEDLTIKIQDSADASSWADILTVADSKSVATLLPDGEFVAPVGMPEDHRRYVRAYYTCSAGTDTFSGTFNTWVGP